MADRLVIIDQGKIIAEGTPQELRHQEVKEVAFTLVLQAPRDEAWAAVKSIPNTRDVRLVSAQGNEVRLTGMARSLSDVSVFANQFIKQKSWAVKELSSQEPSLEEVFLGLFRRSA